MRLIAAVVWLATFALSASSFGASNDHFDRISRARQIARYGEIPFRDFFDPGYFATLFSSAALQRLIGDNLLGETLLTAGAIATGGAVLFLLATRLSGSIAIGLGAALWAVLSMPRPYDFDKFLFYPFGIYCCWRYAERQGVANLVRLGILIVIAGMFRYDNGVFITAGAVAAIVTVHVDDIRTAGRRIAVLAGIIGAVAAPILLFLHLHGGFGTVIDQLVTYARREGARTRLSMPPVVSIGRLASIEAAPASATVITVRWAPGVDAARRHERALSHGLLDEKQKEQHDDRTFSYVIGDHSSIRIRQLVNDPHVEDTGGIDRARLVLASEESLWTRISRRVPLLRVRVLPDALTLDNAAAFLYYLCILLPLGAAARLWRGRARFSTLEAARVVTLVVVCLAVDMFILRDPVAARIGGMIGLAAVLAAWLFRPSPRHTAVTAAMLLVVVVAVASVSATGDWTHRVLPQLTHPVEQLRGNLSVMSASPVPLSQLPTGRLEPVVEYVRRCTKPDDYVFATWFVPELFFFTQRGFAGGMAVTFGGHWSEERFQRQIVERLQRQSVPIVVVETRSYESFAADYPLVDRYFARAYRMAGELGGPQADADGYRVLVSRARVPVGMYQGSALPCFR